jgi:hypothetical protein
MSSISYNLNYITTGIIAFNYNVGIKCVYVYIFIYITIIILLFSSQSSEEVRFFSRRSV